MFVDCMHRVPSRRCNRLSHTNIVPNVIQSHWMPGCGILQAQGQNVTQMRPMSLDDSQTSQQTLVQWHQCQCCIVGPCLHAEQPGDGVAADSLSCACMFSGDAVMRSCVRPKSCGDQCIAGPQLKSWGTCLPRSPWLLMLRLCLRPLCVCPLKILVRRIPVANIQAR